MQKETLLKLIIAIELLAIFALPEFGKELFVEKTGKFGHPDFLVALLLIFGLFWDWKYIEQVIMVICSLLLFSSIILFSFYISEPLNKPGFLIYLPILLLTIFTTYKLKKL